MSVSSEEISHFSHEHRLTYAPPTRPRYCNLCNQVGFNAIYGCQDCNFFLHKECATASSDTTVGHPFSTKCELRLNKDGKNSSRLCRACGKKINEFAYSCLCSYGKRYLHPVCLSLEKTLVVADGLTLSLKKSVTSDCLRCGEKDLNRSISGWGYVSPDGKLCYHVSCVRAITDEFWKKSRVSELKDPLEPIRRSFPLDQGRSEEREQKKRSENRKKMGQSVVKTLVSIGKLLIGIG